MGWRRFYQSRVPLSSSAQRTGTQVARLALDDRSVPLAEVQIALVGLLDLRAPAALPSALRTDTPMEATSADVTSAAEAMTPTNAGVSDLSTLGILPS
jgi:hypothetical protein